MTQHPYAVLMAGEAPPKYRQIAEALRARIASGEYAPGSRVPSKSALMQAHGVSLNTVNDALKLLIAEGLIRTVQGSGTFVSDPLPGPPEPSPEYRAVMGRIDEISEEVRQLRGEVEALKQAREA